MNQVRRLFPAFAVILTSTAALADPPTRILTGDAASQVIGCMIGQEADLPRDLKTLPEQTGFVRIDMDAGPAETYISFVGIGPRGKGMVLLMEKPGTPPFKAVYAAGDISISTSPGQSKDIADRTRAAAIVDAADLCLRKFGPQTPLQGQIAAKAKTGIASPRDPN